MSAPAISRVRELLSCDPQTGVVTRRIGRGGRLAGDIVGCIRPDGYLTVMVCKRPVLVHRVVWCLVHGEWPNGVIDHINGNRADNRIANLRVTTQRGNMLNQTKSRRNTLNVAGVDLLSSGSFRARLKTRGRTSAHLGTFATLAEASDAYQAAKAAQIREECKRCC